MNLRVITLFFLTFLFTTQASGQIILKQVFEPINFRLVSGGQDSRTYSQDSPELLAQVPQLKNDEIKGFMDNLFPRRKMFLMYNNQSLAELTSGAIGKFDQILARKLIASYLQDHGFANPEISNINAEKNGEITFQSSQDYKISPDPQTFIRSGPHYHISDISEKNFVAQLNKELKSVLAGSITLKKQDSELKIGESKLIKEGDHFVLRRRVDDKKTIINKSQQHEMFRGYIKQRYPTNNIVEFGVYKIREVPWDRDPMSKQEIQTQLSRILASLGADDTSIAPSSIDIGNFNYGYYPITITYSERSRVEKKFVNKDIEFDEGRTKYKYGNVTKVIKDDSYNRAAFANKKFTYTIRYEVKNANNP